MKNIISKNVLKHSLATKESQPKKLSMKDFDVVVENTKTIKGGAVVARRHRDDIGH